MKRILSIAILAMSAQAANAQVICFVSHPLPGATITMQIDYGRSLVYWMGDWKQAEITETWVHWNTANIARNISIYFDRNSFMVIENNHYREGYNNSDFVNRTQFQKTQCTRPRDLDCTFFAGTTTHAQTGIASIYSGRKTANGERMSSSAMTAAHRTLPFGTMVRVTNVVNGRSATVRINDRGPFIRSRVIDLTLAAARAIGMNGTTRVRLERK